jgi:hypothetical protein
MSSSKKVSTTATVPRLTPKKAAQLQRQRKRRRKQILTWSAVGVGLVAVVALALLFLSSQGIKSDIPGVVSYSNLDRSHVNGAVSYPQSPPVGGAHSPIWQNCGIYDKPIANENGVHSLEHGAVWVTYQPDLPANTVEQLRSQVRGHSSLLLSPYPGLSSPVVASAWGLQLKLNDASDPRLAQFISAYEQGPQTPEPGASCSGGLGNPLK